MKRIVFYALIFVLLTARFVFAVDEKTYIKFAADSILAAHKYKGDSESMSRWIAEMQEKYPDFMSEDWESFEEKMIMDSRLKDRVYRKILRRVKRKGYKAHTVELSNGNTTITIEDKK